MTETEERIVMSDGFELFTRHWTAAEPRREMLCIHGIAAHSAAFRKLAGRLAADGTNVHAIDLRGMGNSTEQGLQRGDVSDFKRHLDDIDEVVKQLRGRNEGKKLFMMGHSLGGAYALWYASSHRGTINGLVLLAPGVVPAHNPSFSNVLRLLFMSLFTPTGNYDIPFPKTFSERDFKLLSADPLVPKGYSARYVKNFFLKIVRGWQARASSISAPTLVIQGGADDLVSPTGTERLLEKLKFEDKKLEALPDANHWLYYLIFPMTTPFDDAAKQNRVILTITDWLGSH